MLVRQKIIGIIRRGKSGTDPIVLFICFLICVVYVFGSSPLYVSPEKAVADVQIKKAHAAPSIISYEAPENEYLNSTKKLDREIVARKAMGPCRPFYGKVTIMVAVVTSSYQRFYNVAQDSLHCYLKSTNYTFLLIDLDTDKRVNEQCGHNMVISCGIIQYRSLNTSKTYFIGSLIAELDETITNRQK